MVKTYWIFSMFISIFLQWFYARTCVLLVRRQPSLLIHANGWAGHLFQAFRGQTKNRECKENNSLCTLSINIKRFPFHIHLYLGIRKEWKWKKGGGPCQKSNYQTWSQRNWNSRNKTLHVQVKEHCTIPFRTGLVRNETRGIIKITKYLFYNEITLTFPYKTMQVNVL